jgi:flagellar basal body rod protein FlgB
LRTWSERQGQACELEHVKLSTSRSPPRVIHAPPAQSVPARTEREIAPRKQNEPQDPWLNLFNAGFKAAEKVGAFSAWLDSPPPPPPPPKVTPAPPAPKPVPPFDIQDVPKAMRKLGMPMAAKLQERWFSGAANYSRSKQDLKDEIDQNGVRYTAAMVDSTTIRMEWVLSFSRAKKAFDELIQKDLRSLAALDILKSELAPYRNRQDIVAWNVANSDFLEFHKKFQFQLIAVNATWGERISQFLDRSIAAQGVPDDLTGALGSFNIYVAVRYARFEWSSTARVAVVTDVSVYVRDPYEFSDEQYLGHWSPSHVAVVPAHQVAGGNGWLDYPVVDGSVYDKDSVLYPVTNKDYRDWRSKHGQGGDFMIYTDRVDVKLDSPIRVVL